MKREIHLFYVSPHPLQLLWALGQLIFHMECNESPTAVIIGSYALQQHGFRDIEPRDIDLICDLPTAQMLAWEADVKLGPGLFEFKHARSNDDEQPDVKREKVSTADGTAAVSTPNKQRQKVVVDITLANAHEGKDELYRRCVGTYVVNTHLNDRVQLKGILPPLAWLYALMRAHLHRIPRIAASQSANIGIWEKYMDRYHMIRSHVGYVKLDRQFAESADCQAIFNEQFDYVTKRIGDAPSMQKAEDEFFKDGVRRYLPHDELHEKIAVINRGAGAKPLFPKFQRNASENVEMDQDLFMAASKQEQIATIREELMVLYLERTMLPAVVEHNDPLDPAKGLSQFNHIVAHFITNLCGCGHSWLRQYCIDHWLLVRDPKTYPFARMREFANTFRKEGMVVLEGNDALPSRIDSLEAFLAYHELVKAAENNGNHAIYKTLCEYLPKDVEDVSGHVYAVEFDRDEFWLNEVDTTSIPDDDDDDSPLTEVKRRFFGPKCGTWLLGDADDSFIVYNPLHGIGFDDTHNTLFLIECETGENGPYYRRQSILFGIHTCVVPPENPEIVAADYNNGEKACDIDQKSISYYKSTCDGGYEAESQYDYLNCYGEGFEDLAPLTEVLARVALKFYVDEEESEHY